MFRPALCSASNRDRCRIEARIAVKVRGRGEDSEWSRDAFDV